MKYKDDRVHLPSGRKFYANNGIVGLSVDGSLGVSEGYDGGVVEGWD